MAVSIDAAIKTKGENFTECYNQGAVFRDWILVCGHDTTNIQFKCFFLREAFLDKILGPN